MQLDIVVYSKSACPQRDTVKNLPKVRNIAFEGCLRPDEPVALSRRPVIANERW